MYAISSLDHDKLPGVIFTLKEVNESFKPIEYNPLYPYYIVYVYEDGTIKFNYLYIKKILDFYKKLFYEHTNMRTGDKEIFKNYISIH